MEYTASLKVFGKISTATGATAIEAVENLKPEVKKGTGLLTLSRGESSRIRVLNGGQVFRLFAGSRIMREIALKNISMLFSDV